MSRRDPRKLKHAIYEVSTWEAERGGPFGNTPGGWTRQAGMRRRFKGLAGLLRAVRQLRSFGYAGRKGDVSSLIKRIDAAYLNDPGLHTSDIRDRADGVI